jgi:hypothetical protein
MVRYVVISFSLGAVASGLFFLLRARPKTYTPGESMDSITSELERPVPAGYPNVKFVNAARQAGIDFRHFGARRSTQLPEDMASAAAWGDYDGDGWLDLYICNIAAPMTATPEQVAASPASNRLYHNDGNGHFTDVTERAGVGFRGVGNGVAWADYNNDGTLDLIVTSYDRLVLYRNRRDGTFQDVSKSAGLDTFRGYWAGPAWADYDRDGFVDLYICGYVKYKFDPGFVGKSSRQYTEMVPFTINPSSYPPEPNLLFHNNGNGTFTEVGKKLGVDNPTGRSLSASWADYNNDGWPDLYVANDISDNVFFLNLGNGKFRDISHPAWVADYRGAMGLAAGDWDNDGDLDMFVTHWIAQENALYSNLLLTPGAAAESKTLRFQDIADMQGLGQIALSVIGWGAGFFDYDNDGFLDILAVNGSTFQKEDDPAQLVAMKNFLFWNKGPEEGYFEVGEVAGSVFQEAHVGRGATFGDYDNDGDVDVFIVNHNEAPTLLRNEGGNRKNWLTVRLRGSRSNRSGIGTRVMIETDTGKQMQEIGSQPFYMSQSNLDAHFGLGAASRVRKLMVIFPSGIQREQENVAANQVLVVTE